MNDTVPGRGCRGCSSTELTPVLDLGKVPAADNFPLARSVIETTEIAHPLRLDRHLERNRKRAAQSILFGREIRERLRVIGIAREKLGMGPPAPENVVRLTSRSLTRPAVATAPSGARK